MGVGQALYPLHCVHTRQAYLPQLGIKLSIAGPEVRQALHCLACQPPYATATYIG